MWKYFYHDNYHKHKAKLKSEWINNKKFEWMNVLQWSTQSCDLSPADSLWHYLKTALRKHVKLVPFPEDH